MGVRHLTTSCIFPRVVRLVHSQRLKDPLTQQICLWLPSDRLESMRDSSEEQVAVLEDCSEACARGEMTHAICLRLDVQSLVVPHSIVSRDTSAMRHGIKDGDMSCPIVVLENKIVTHNSVEWSIPFDVGIVILVLDQQSCERGRK